MQVTETYCTSGTSPTLPSTPPLLTPSLHVLGAGQVGRAFLSLLPNTPFRLIGLTDSSATLHHRHGLDSLALAAFKGQGGKLAQRAGAENVPAALALGLTQADVVVDATATNVSNGQAAVKRSLAALQAGSHLVLCAKDSICLAVDRLLQLGVNKVGLNAVLGGTGLTFRFELPELRTKSLELALVGNASTTAVIQAVEAGDSIEGGIAKAQAQGVLETDPSLDLDGTDAAVKLAIVTGALWHGPVDIASIPRQHLNTLDPDVLRERQSRGFTTRLVARGRRDGALQVSYEELPLTSPLAVPADRVVYTYTLASGVTRVHVGQGLGPDGTASALLDDLWALYPQCRPHCVAS